MVFTFLDDLWQAPLTHNRLKNKNNFHKPYRKLNNMYMYVLFFKNKDNFIFHKNHLNVWTHGLRQGCLKIWTHFSHSVLKVKWGFQEGVEGLEHAATP